MIQYSVDQLGSGQWVILDLVNTQLLKGPSAGWPLEFRSEQEARTYLAETTRNHHQPLPCYYCERITMPEDRAAEVTWWYFQPVGPVTKCKWCAGAREIPEDHTIVPLDQLPNGPYRKPGRENWNHRFCQHGPSKDRTMQCRTETIEPAETALATRLAGKLKYFPTERIAPPG